MRQHRPAVVRDQDSACRRRVTEHLAVGPSGKSSLARILDIDAWFAAPQAEVVDVTGAGDSMSAGYLHAWLAVGEVVEAAHFGQALASLTVESTDTVRADLTPDLVEARVRRDLPTVPEGA